MSTRFQLTGGIGFGQTNVGGVTLDTGETVQSDKATVNISVGYGLSNQLSIIFSRMGTRADNIEGGNVASIASVARTTRGVVDSKPELKRVRCDSCRHEHSSIFFCPGCLFHFLIKDLAVAHEFQPW